MVAFEYVPVIQDTSAAKLKVVSISGLSTKHGDAHHTRGRLYGQVTAGYKLDVYADPARASKVLSGTGSAYGEYFDLTAENGSGLSGRAIIESFSSTATPILIPTFAIDADVIVAQSACAQLPGYDESDGLAAFHAAAMREILTAGLPAILPALFGGNGLAAFTPDAVGIELPDLRLLANPDMLRVAQGHLAKALSAREAETAVEWQKIAEVEYQRYAQAMDRLAALNLDEKEAAADEAPRQTGGAASGSWLRG